VKVRRGDGALRRLGAALDRRWARSAERLPTGPETLALPGGRLRVRLGGGPRGIPVVVVPDPPNVIGHYDGLFGRIAAGGPVAIVEAPGFGFSAPASGARYRVGELSAALEELLIHLDFRGATLSLACVGAFAAIDLAARRPDLVGRLVLSQIASRAEMAAWVKRKDVGGIIQTPLVGQLAVRAARYRIARWWYGASLPPGADPGPYEAHALAALRAGAAFPLASAFQEFARDPGAPVLLRQDVTVLVGAADPTHAGTNLGSARGEVAGARLVAYPRAGHFPDLENPDDWLGFLRGAPGAG
jgi:pimeloyl-ACP methyl ester carboxylesterase